MELSLTKKGLRIAGRNVKIEVADGVVTFPGNNDLTIDTPGEFEVQGTMITGVEGPSYVMQGDSTSVGVLADKEADLDAEAMEQFSELSALVVPVGGVLDVAAAATLIGKLEPTYVVPIPEDKTALDKFLAEMGAIAGETQAKLKLGKDMPEETTVVVLDQVA